MQASTEQTDVTSCQNEHLNTDSSMPACPEVSCSGPGLPASHMPADKDGSTGLLQQQAAAIPPPVALWTTQQSMHCLLVVSVSREPTATHDNQVVIATCAITPFHLQLT